MCKYLALMDNCDYTFITELEEKKNKVALAAELTTATTGRKGRLTDSGHICGGTNGSPMKG